MQTEWSLLSIAMAILTGVAAGQGPIRVHYSLTPEMRIDGDATDLSAVTFVIPTRAGGAVLGQLQDRTLRYFDANGRPIGTFGRSGEGPGEFRQMVTGGLKGDTVWVFDLTLLRLTLVTPDRKLLRTARASSGSGFPPYVRAVFGPDSLVLWGHGAPRNGRFERAFLRGKAEPVGIFPPSLPTSNLPVIADFPPFGCSARSGAAGIAIPYCHRPTEAASGDGGRVAVLTKPEGADSQDYDLTVLSRAGDTLISRSYHPTRFPIRAGVYWKAVDEAAGTGSGGVPLTWPVCVKRCRRRHSTRQPPSHCLMTPGGCGSDSESRTDSIGRFLIEKAACSAMSGFPQVSGSKR